MNHLDRLLSRALATPRDAPRPLFDPFDQVAPLALDPPPPLHVAHAAEPAPAREGEPATEPLVLPPSRPAPASPAADATTSPPPPTILPAASQRMAAPVAPTSTARSAAASPSADATPLARADEFMRALGVALPEPQPVASTRTLRPEAATPAALEAPHIAPAHRPTAARETATALPPRPHREPVMAPLPPRTETAPAPATARRAPAAAPIEHVVERTVVVSSSSSSLEDLAHASRIVRFGLGQG